MKRLAFLRWATTVVVQLPAMLAWASVAHAQTVGRIAGSYTVSPTGAATYSIPIFAPRGPAGLQPDVALVYNSQAGNGIVGVGWNLAGLSSISRCNLTYAQDEAPAPITLSTSDGYCLDGQRLRLTSGTYGEAGSIYQTEIANFAYVTAYGSYGNGPAYFLVQQPNGLVYEYGNPANNSEAQVEAGSSGTAYMWMLDKVSDPAGNTMTISYLTTNGTSAVVPHVISWTPTSHGATSYAYTMTFTYGTNPSTAGGANINNGNPCIPYPNSSPGQPIPLVCILNGYVAGVLVQEGSLLSSITVDYNGSQVKEYVLSYTQSATGRDTLTKLQECATSASDCLYPTTFSYQAASPGVSTSSSVGVSTPISPCIPTVPPAAGASVTRYDFNGDGLPDLLYSQGSTCYVAFAYLERGRYPEYQTPVSAGLPSNALNYKILAGDLLGTGKAGILANNNGTWYYYTWNGSSFVGTSTGVAYDQNAIGFALADVNGDGLPDLVSLYGPSTISLTTRLNTSSGGTPSFSSSVVTTAPGGGALSAWLITPDTQFGNVKSFDFNGDGRQDLALEVVVCQTYYMGYCVENVAVIDELIAQTGGTFAVSQVAQPPPPNTGFSPAAFVNLNDDACTDLVGYTAGIYVSACNGGTAATLSPQYPIVAVMDWNGDGLPDLIENSGSGTLSVQLSTGAGFSPATSTSVPYDSNCTYVTYDADGDGQDDLGCMSNLSGTAGFSYFVHNNEDSPPDLLASITDGYGNTVQPTYESMIWAYTSGAGNYTPGNDAQYPYESYWVPLYLVTQTEYSDPTGPESHIFVNNTYEDAWFNLKGRGFAGFAAFGTAYATGDFISETIGYRQDFPYTGMVISDTGTNPAGGNVICDAPA